MRRKISLAPREHVNNQKNQAPTTVYRITNFVQIALSKKPQIPGLSWAIKARELR